MDFQTSKILGGIGGIIAAIGILSYGILTIIGLILILIALRGFADYYGREEIFRNALIAIIIAIVGIIIAVGIMLASMAAIGFTSMMGPPMIEPSMHMGISLAGVIIGIVILFVVFLLSAVFFKRALDILAQESGHSLIGTAGLLYFIGAILVLAFGIGIILMIVALLILGIAFFMMEEKPKAKMSLQEGKKSESISDLEERLKPYEIT